VEVLGDLHLIERALTNLIDNALRHTTGEDKVRVSVQRW
jgi:signal transduction histidine kinase